MSRGLNKFPLAHNLLLTYNMHTAVGPTVLSGLEYEETETQWNSVPFIFYLGGKRRITWGSFENVGWQIWEKALWIKTINKVQSETADFGHANFHGNVEQRLINTVAAERAMNVMNELGWCPWWKEIIAKLIDELGMYICYRQRRIVLMRNGQRSVSKSQPECTR